MTKDWTNLRHEVQQLYVLENRKLVDIMRIIQTRHGFKASERSYRTQLRKWGYMKYNVQDNTPSRPKPSTSKRNRSSGGADAHIPVPYTSSLGSRDLGTSLVNPVNVSATSFHTGRTSNSYFEDQDPFQPIRSTPTKSVWMENSTMWPEGNKTHLFLAVLRQREDEVERALSQGVPANSQDAQCISALYHAASMKSSKIVSLLLNHGADVNAKGFSGQTPLHRAASNATITHLLLAAGADINTQDVDGNTPAHLAVPFSTADMGETSALHVLVNHESTLNTRNHAGITPFHLILEQHELDLEFFLERGASVTLCFPDGLTPLGMLLSKLGDFETWVVTFWADTVRLMIEEGADPCSLLTTGEPLVLAYIESLPKMGHSFREDMPLGRALCKHADSTLPASTEAEPRNSLLHALSRNCGTDDGPKLQFGSLFDNVLRQGADPNIRDKFGRTPLLLLVMSQRNNREAVFDCVKILILHGASPWISDLEGNNAILVAKESPRYSDTCLHYFLKASLESQIGLIWKCDRRSTHHHCQFPEWIEAVDADDWTESTRCISAASTSFRLEGLKACMLKVLAEWYLETSADRFAGESGGMEQRRRYNAQIIRDCHKFGIRLDLDYYDYLLDLCL